MTRYEASDTAWFPTRMLHLFRRFRRVQFAFSTPLTALAAIPLMALALPPLADVARAEPPPCKLQRWAGTTTDTYYRNTRTRNSIGTAWFSRGIEISFAYEYRLLFGEPVRKFVPKVAIPHSIEFDTNASGFSDIRIVYDPKLNPEAYNIQEIEAEGRTYATNVFRVGAKVMQGTTLSGAQMRMVSTDVQARNYLQWHTVQGIFAVPGGSGWDVEGAPGWANAYSASDANSGARAERDNKQAWCRIQASQTPLLTIELDKMEVSVEGVIANLRRLSPEFNELLRRRGKKPLVSAMAAGMQAAGGSERAKALMRRALEQIGGRLDAEDRKEAERTLERAELSNQAQSLVDAANAIARQIPGSAEAKPEFDKSLVRKVHTLARDLDGEAGYREDLHRIAERVHRLTLIGRLPPLDVILLVDNSGSMGKVFTALKNEVGRLMHDIETISPSAELGMIAYNDRRYERFARRPATAEGRQEFASYLSGLGASAGDAAFGDLLREFLTRSPFRADARARIILVFGDIPDETRGEKAAAHARALRERYPGTIVVPIWTGSDAPPQSITEVAAASGNRVIHFDAGRGKIRDVILAGLGLDEYKAAGSGQ